MLNKNDPLIGAVQEVMKRNHAEREATRLVNEKFGIADRRALPHERQREWESAYQQVLSESADLAALAPPHHKVTKKDVLVGRGVLKKHPSKPGKHVLAKEEEQLDERKVNPYAVGMAAVQKSTGDKPPMEKKNITKAHKIAKKIIAKKKMNEGFNSRHGLSESASARMQALAVLNEDTSEYMDQEFERRGLQPPGGGMPGGGALKKTRVGGGKVRVDTPAGFNTRTGKVEKLSAAGKARFKKRLDAIQRMGDKAKSPVKRITSKKKPPQQQGPAKPPSGTFLDNLAKARRNVGMDKPAAPSLAAGAARRPSGVSTVPKIRQTGSSAGSNLPQGPWGGINRRGGASTRQTGLAAGTARRPAGQSTPPMRQQGTTLPPPKSSGLLRRGGAALAAGATALDIATKSVGNQPPAANAGNKKETWPGQGRTGKIGGPLGTKYDERVPQEPQGGITKQSKIEAPARKVTDTEIMNAPEYKKAVKSVGGEAGARKIQPGTNVPGVGTIKKDQTIWSQVKSKLEKQPVKGFEMGANKGGAGR